MKFLSVILTIIIIYYVLKLIGQIVFPWLLKRWVNSMAKRHAEAFGHAGNPYQQQEKGKVTVQHNQKTNKNNSHEGEYVDYEEVK